MSTKITYTNKVAIQNDETIADNNKVTAEDMNEIKQVVNNNADELEQKQQKQEGKGLSTNDFTDELKEKLEGLNSYDDTQLKQNIADIQQEQITQNTNISNLQKDNTTNKENIANIQDEQTAQNTNIKTNTDNIEALQQEKAELEAECERLREDINVLPTVSGSGESVTLNGTAEARFKKFEIGGNSKQETREGYNLLDMRNAKSGTDNGVTATINGDGTYSLTGTATSYIANIWILGGYKPEGVTDDNTLFILKAGTYYIKDVQLFTGITGVGGTNGIYTITEDTQITRVRVPQLVQGTTYSETKYPIVTLSNKALPWQPYGAMPSTKFQSPIQAVKDKINFTICNKNLIQIDKTKFPFSKNGLDFNLNENGELVVNGTASAYTEFNIYEKGKKYFLKLAKEKYYRFSNGTDSNKVSIYLTGEKLIQFNNITTKRMDSNIRLHTLILQVQSGVTFSNEVFKLMLEEVQTSSSSSTEHVEHKEQSLTFPLKQKFYKNSYLADDGIHHKRKTIVLAGTEELATVDTGNGFNRFCYKQPLMKKGTNMPLLCSHFKQLQTSETETNTRYKECIASSGGENYRIMFVVSEEEFPTSSSWKDYLVQQKTNGTPVTVEYDLDEEEIEEYSEEQQVVYNKIKSTAKSYGDVTHIFSTDEISPIFDVEARADITAMFNNLQAQVLANEEV